MDYFSHVETSDSGDGVARVYDGGCFPLSFGEYDIDHFHGVGDRFDSLEVVGHDCWNIFIILDD